MSTLKFEAAQLQRFRALVHHAQTCSPYYARIIREQGLDPATCLPADFPQLTKKILMANFDDIVTDRRISKKIVGDFLARSSDPKERLFNEITVLHTSGTSGELGYFLYAPADRARMRRGAWRNVGALRRLFRQLWVGPRRLRIAFYGATGGHYAGASSVAAMQRGLGRLLLEARAFEVNLPLPGVLEGLNEFQPDVIFGYTTALKILADRQRAGSLSVRPRAVFATGEMVTKADIQYLSEAFGGAAASSIYACTEHMTLGFSNVDGETMTLTAENVMFEFHEDHSIITNLFNHTLPLIRYRMSDILRRVSKPGERPIVIHNLVGRMELMPAFNNSAGVTDYISPHTINEIFAAGVTRFQMQITGTESFRFPICVEPHLGQQARDAAVASIEARLREILRQKGLDNVSFEVLIVTDIPLNERTRKFQLVVRQTAAEA
jgi:phenylacetate-CoA ligase